MSRPKSPRRKPSAPKSPTYSLDSMSIDLALDEYTLSPGKLGKDFQAKGKMLLMLKKKNLMNVNEYDQDQYKTIVNPMIRKYLPEHFKTPGKNGEAIRNSEPPSISNPYAYLFCQPSFGYCFYLKTYVIITLFLGMILFFSDPCVHFLMPFHIQLPYIRHLPPSTLIYNNSDFFTISQHSISKNQTISSTEIPRKLEHCSFKYFYIILLFAGAVIYAIIFAIYSCQMIVYYYTFPWYLVESVALFSYSMLLLLASIGCYFLNVETIIPTLEIINCVIGLILACSIYNRHTEGFIPLEFIAKYDPDNNILTKIMTRRQYVTIF